MHEILFRGKRTDNGEWVEGILFNAKEDIFIIPHGNEYSYDPIEGLAFDVYGCKVDPETVGQYTGLTDKNGVKIFEGDILTIENEGVYAAIKYNESNAAFYVEDEDHEDYLGEAWETDVVIIGNIHDNPELLQKI